MIRKKQPGVQAEYAAQRISIGSADLGRSARLDGAMTGPALAGSAATPLAPNTFARRRMRIPLRR